MKREDLPVITPDEFRKFGPRWLRTEECCARYERTAALRAEWNALDVLGLENFCTSEKVWLVTRPRFLPEMLLHEYACRCAEWALSLVDSPDPRSVEAVRVKRRWMVGDATDSELKVAGDAADAAARAARNAEWAAARAAADAAYMKWFTAWTAAESAESAAKSAAPDNKNPEYKIELLRNLIDEWAD